MYGCCFFSNHMVLLKILTKQNNANNNANNAYNIGFPSDFNTFIVQIH